MTTWSGSSFRYLTDPRTRFAFPTIVKLAGGADAKLANAFLQTHHWTMNADALNCEAQQYASLAGSPRCAISPARLATTPTRRSSSRNCRRR